MILSNRKLKLIIIALLLFILSTFLGMFKPKAIEYSIDINMKTQINNGGNKTIQENLPYDDNIVPEIVLDVFKTISCDTDICIASIPLVLNYYTNMGSSSGTTQVLGIYGQLWGASPNYVCTYSNGTIDCPITNGQELKKIEVFLQSNPLYNYSGIVRGTYGAFINVYNVTNVGSSITNIQNNTNNINTSINDSTIDNNQTSTDTTSWSNMNASNGTITNLLTLPITLLQAIVNGLQTTCSSFSLGTLFNTNIVLPCINVGSLIGSGLWATIDILFSGFMILAIGKKLIKIFNDFTNLKTNQMDEIYGGGSK